MDDLDLDRAPQHPRLGAIDAPAAPEADDVEDDVLPGKCPIDERILGLGRSCDLRNGKAAEGAKLVRFVASVSALRTRTCHRPDQISMRESSSGESSQHRGRSARA